MARYIRYNRLKQQINFLNCNNLNSWEDTCNYRLVGFVDVCSSSCNCAEYGVEPIMQYRWNNMNPNYGYYCENDNRYYKQRKEVSYDNGQTWYYTIPEEFQKGDLYEANSRFCTSDSIMFDYKVDEESEPFCNGYNKMQKYVKNVSFDGGTTWEVLTWNKPDGSVYKEYKTNLVEEDSCFCGYEKKKFQFDDEYMCGSEIGAGYRDDYRYEVWREYNLCTNEPTGRVKYINPEPNCDCGFTGTTYIYGGSTCGSDIEVDGLTITHVENGTIMGNTIRTSEIAFNENLDVQIKFNITQVSSIKINFQFSEGSNIFMMENLDKEYDEFINPTINIYTSTYGIEFVELEPGEHFIWLRLNNQTNRDNPITLSAEINAFSTEYDRYASYEYWFERDMCSGVPTGAFEYRYPQISTSCGVPIENANFRMEFLPPYDRTNIIVCNKKEYFDKFYDYVNENEYTVSGSGTYSIYSTSIQPYPFYGVLKYGVSSLNKLFGVDNQYATPLYLTHFSGFYQPNTLLDMSLVFAYCSYLKSADLNSINTSNVTTFSNLFVGCKNLEYIKISGLDTSKCANFSSMFNGCQKIENIDLSNLNTKRATTLASMFKECYSLETINLDNFNTTNVTDFSEMFDGCIKLLSIDVTKFDTSNATNLNSMFEDCRLLNTIDVSNFNTSKVTNFGEMFYNCSGLTSIDITNFDTSNAIVLSNLFNGCSQLEYIDVSNFNTRRVNLLNGMFRDCTSLKSVDVSNFVTNNVNNISNMFENCSGLTTIDVSNFNTYNVTDMASTFKGCSNIESLDLNNFNTTKVTSMIEMFSGCTNLKYLNVTNFSTIKVESMRGMFEDCVNLQELDLSKFDTSKTIFMNRMFKNCSSLKTLDISTFTIPFNDRDVYKTTLDSMFEGCSNLTSIDMSGINRGTVNYYYTAVDMFKGCDKLNHIKCKQEFKDWCISNQTEISLPNSMRSGGSGNWEIID